MRRLLILPLVVPLLVACGPTEQPPPAASSPTPSNTQAPSPPPMPEPTGKGPCPYLSNESVSDANGQKVSKVKTSEDQPHPSCFFYALSGKLQLTVRVFVGEPGIAKAVVDQAAPIDTSNPADEPAGWKGGYQPSGEGAVYAVSKGGSAVVVITNQKQSIKARTVAKEVIGELKL
ncbi:DUF2020 domain-containing protein [Amycolatopsis thailandensis]|uniref:DUF2020 domain-containing protein n=1 Tax=Amycolatopsis thailandensis TaxID=589330 RepID=A0A229SAN7_9PSEU|nr:DUF2020 domain-containing protein [Amycolatopsis thailandensis]OXM55996.1 hypothetical protein CFP71_16090 [Amycolatopsis thailandensis]